MSCFGGTGGYFRLDSWIMANLVQLGTRRFCRQFLNRTNDPCGRSYDQMTQAARSGCANAAEGSAHRTKRQECRTDLLGMQGYPACTGVRELKREEK